MYFLHSVEEFEGVVRDKQDFSKTASLNADVFTFKCEEKLQAVAPGCSLGVGFK